MKTDINTRRLIDCALIKAVDRTSKGHLRLQTAFLYPDGSHVDLFIKNSNDLLTTVEPVTLTDFGNTISWLSNLQISPMKSKARAAIVADVLETYGVANVGASLEIKVGPGEENAAIIRLGQACLRIADLYYKTRFVSLSKFNDEIEEMLSEWNLDYIADSEIRGRFDNVVKVDFRVLGSKAETAVLSLPSDKYPSAARQRAEHVFAIFSDLTEWQGQRVAALDDRAITYADIDLERIATVATVVPVFDDQESFREILRAA